MLLKLTITYVLNNKTEENIKKNILSTIVFKVFSYYTIIPVFFNVFRHISLIYYNK